MLKIGGIYSLRNNLYIVIFDKGFAEYYYGFCFFSSFQNNKKLQKSIKNQIQEYSQEYDLNKNYVQWCYVTEDILKSNISGYIGQIDEEILQIGNKIFEIVDVATFEYTYNYCFEQYNCMNCKHLTQTFDYTGSELYYFCNRDDTINGYIEDMEVSNCENFETRD